MAKENSIDSKGCCPFSVSGNLNIETSSYDLKLDGIIVRYGSVSGFRASELVAPFHVFLMNISDHDVVWKISAEEREEQVLMEPNQIFFNPAGVPFSRVTDDHYEFLLVLIEPEKMVVAAPLASSRQSFRESYGIKNPNLEHIFKLLLAEIQTGNQNGKLFIETIIPVLLRISADFRTLLGRALKVKQNQKKNSYV